MLLSLRSCSSLLSTAIFCSYTSAASLSLPTAKLSWQCWQKSLQLFADLSCSLNGSSFLTSPNLQQEPLSEPIAPFIPLSSLETSPSGSPWSFIPVCTAFLPALEAPLCVYTSIAFAHGRGISILTTPELAVEFASLPSIRSPSDVPPDFSVNQFHITRPTRAKGRVALAEKDIHRHERIGASMPILISLEEHVLSWQEREELMRAAVLRLPPTTQSLLRNMTAYAGGPDFMLSGIAINHGGFSVEMRGREHFGIFPEMVFYNHHCAPK